MRVTLQLEDPEDPEGDAQDLVEWSAVGFLFVLALLSFADARPRGFSESEYSEVDELRLADFVDGLIHRRGGALSGSDDRSPRDRRASRGRARV